MKIVMDMCGGDKPSRVLVDGMVAALQARADLEFVLVGGEEQLKRDLSEAGADSSKFQVVGSTEVITNDDMPTTAIKTKKDSSLVKALEIVKNDESVVGLISAGSTGAVLTGAVLKVGRIEGVMRPALAPLLPTKLGTDVCLVDCGANVDCRPEFLTQFALMGVSYMKSVNRIENPRVGLVSVGVEDKKGNELTKEVFKNLKELPINFVGNMEARDALSADYDVLVADGFVGNVLLKSVEGTAGMVMYSLKKAIMSSGSAKFGSLFMKKAFKKLKSDMDYNTRGGAPFLGINKIIVKAHGASNAVAIKAAVLQVAKMAEGKLVENIRAEMKKYSKPSEKTDA